MATNENNRSADIKLLRSLLSEKPQLATTPKEKWPSDVQYLYDVFQENPNLNVSGELVQPQGETLTNENHEKNSHDNRGHVVHGHGGHVGSGRGAQLSGGYIEDNPLYVENYIEARGEWEKQRNEATSELKNPTFELEDPRYLNHKSYEDYQIAKEEYKRKREQYEQDLKNYDEQRQIKLSQKGFSNYYRNNYFCGSVDPNYITSTIHDRAKRETLRMLEEQSKKNTLAGIRAKRLLEKYKAAELSEDVHARNSYYIQMMHQRANINIQTRTGDLYQAAKKNNPSLSFKNFVNSEEYKNFVRDARLAGIKKFQEEHPELAERYKHELERQKVLSDHKLSKEEKKRRIKELNKQEKKERGNVFVRHVRVFGQRMERYGARINAIASVIRHPRKSFQILRNSWNEYKANNYKKWENRIEAALHPIKTTKAFFNKLNFVKQAKLLFKDPAKFVNNLNVVKNFQRRINMIRNTFRFIASPAYRAEQLARLAGNIKSFFTGIGNAIQSIGTFFQSIGGLFGGAGGAVEAGATATAAGATAAATGATVAAEAGATAAAAGATTAAEATAVGTAAAATNIAGAIMALLGASWGAFLTIIIIFFLAFIFFIVFLFFLLLHPNPPVYIQVACTEDPGISDAKGLHLVMHDKFGVDVVYNGSGAQFDNNTPFLNQGMVINKRIYNALCRLYGHTQGNTTNNPFATLFRGDPNGNRNYISPNGVTRIDVFLSTDPTAQAIISQRKAQPCTMENGPFNKLDGTTNLNLWIYEPDLCDSASPVTDINANSDQFEFTLDYYLAKALYYRIQDELKQNSLTGQEKTILSDFQSSVYSNGTSLLPNPECQASGKEQNIACFSDMIADYMTWGGSYHNFNTSTQGQGAMFGKAAQLASQFVWDVQGANTPGTPPPSNAQSRCIDTTYGGGANHVNNINVSCLTKLPNTKIPNSTYVNWAVANVNPNTYFQCMGFVQVVSDMLGAEIGKGNAGSFIGKSVPGYTWHSVNSNDTISPGDIALFTNGGVGHIAYVVQVNCPNKDANGGCNIKQTDSFKQAQANEDGLGKISFVNYCVKTSCNNIVLQGWQSKNP